MAAFNITDFDHRTWDAFNGAERFDTPPKYIGDRCVEPLHLEVEGGKWIVVADNRGFEALRQDEDNAGNEIQECWTLKCDLNRHAKNMFLHGLGNAGVNSVNLVVIGFTRIW